MRQRDTHTTVGGAVTAVIRFAADPPHAPRPPVLRGEDQTLLRRAQLFTGVAPADIDVLLPKFTLRELPRRHTLFAQGEQTPGELYVVLSGSLAVTRRIPSGQARTSLVGPGETFGELSVLDPGPRASTATATVDSRVAVLDGRTFLTWCTQRPYLTERLLRVLARRLRRSNDATLDLLFVDIGARLAAALTEITQRFPATELGGVRVEHGLSQRELGQLIGSSRETVNKLLQNFAERGWIEHSPGVLHVLDPTQLAARARTSNTPKRTRVPRQR